MDREPRNSDSSSTLGQFIYSGCLVRTGTLPWGRSRISNRREENCRAVPARGILMIKSVLGPKRRVSAEQLPGVGTRLCKQAVQRTQ